MEQTIIFQRIEGGVIFLACLSVYFFMGLNIIGFLVFLLVFDLSMLGYMFGNKIGAFVYNLGHSLMIPVMVLGLGVVYDSRLLISIGLLWSAHIGMDRSLGYGLKLPSDFKDTHLGHIGKK